MLVSDWRTSVLKLQPYVQSSLAPSSNHKLSFKFFRYSRSSLRLVQWHTSWNFQPLWQFMIFFMSPSLRRKLPLFYLTWTTLCSFPNAFSPSAWCLVEFIKYIRGSSNGRVRLRLYRHATWEDLEALRQCFPTTGDKQVLKNRGCYYCSPGRNC